jgi:hypothetical protein
VAPSSKTVLATERPRNVDHSMGSNLSADRRVSHSSHCVGGLNFWSDNGFLGIAPPGTRVWDFLYRTGHSNAVFVVRPDWSTNPISGCALIRTVPSGFENVFSITEQRENRSLQVPPRPLAADFKFEMQAFQILGAVNPSKYIQPHLHWIGNRWSSLRKSNPLSRLISAGHITSTIFAYRDSAAPCKERYFSRLEHASVRWSSVAFAQSVA